MIMQEKITEILKTSIDAPKNSIVSSFELYLKDRIRDIEKTEEAYLLKILEAASPEEVDQVFIEMYSVLENNIELFTLIFNYDAYAASIIAKRCHIIANASLIDKERKKPYSKLEKIAKKYVLYYKKNK
jgi:hypothetical protein